MMVIQFMVGIILAIILAKFFPFFNDIEGETMTQINLNAFKTGYGTDLNKETEGVWQTLSMLPDTQIRIAKTNNPKYEKLMRKLYKPYSRTLRRGKELAPEIMEEITNKLVAETIITDWKNMPGVNGTVPYSKQEAYNLISQPDLKELKEEILAYADDFAAFQAEEEEAIKGN